MILSGRSRLTTCTLELELSADGRRYTVAGSRTVTPRDKAIAQILSFLDQFSA